MKAILGAVAALMLCAGPALAQTSYPEQSVRILVGFPAGTAPDVAARLLADKFNLAWGKPVIVDPKRRDLSAYAGASVIKPRTLLPSTSVPL